MEDILKKIIIILILFVFSLYIFGKSNDPNEKVIYKYYELLCSPETLEKAYEMSPKKVSFDTFKKWYGNIVIVFVKELKKNKDGTYSVRVHIGENLDNGKEVSAYNVIMKVKGGKIIESQSKPIDSVVEYSFPYKNQEVLIVDDIKQNAVVFYISDKKNSNKRELKKMNYDRWGISINSCEIISDLLLAEFTSFDYAWSTMIDLQNKKEVKVSFTNLFFSSDKKYILSYGDNPMTGGGLALEVYNGKIISKVILNDEYCITNINFYTKDNNDYIKFMTEDMMGKKENKIVNLTEIVKNN